MFSYSIDNLHKRRIHMFHNLLFPFKSLLNILCNVARLVCKKEVGLLGKFSFLRGTEINCFSRCYEGWFPSANLAQLQIWIFLNYKMILVKLLCRKRNDTFNVFCTLKERLVYSSHPIPTSLFRLFLFKGWLDFRTASGQLIRISSREVLFNSVCKLL